MQNAKSSMREKIAKAFERVSKRRIKALVDLLTLIGGPAKETPSPAFRPISPQSTDQELKSIVYHARKLAQLLEGMHGTTIAALADTVIHDDEGTPYKLNIGIVRQLAPIIRTLGAASLAATKELAEITRRQNGGNGLKRPNGSTSKVRSAAPEARGAPPNGRVIAVGNILA